MHQTKNWLWCIGATCSAYNINSCRLLKCTCAYVADLLDSTAFYLCFALANSNISPSTYMGNNMLHTYGRTYAMRSAHTSNTRCMTWTVCSTEYITHEKSSKNRPMAINEATTNALDFAEIEVTRNRIASTVTYCHRFWNIVKFAYIPVELGFPFRTEGNLPEPTTFFVSLTRR